MPKTAQAHEDWPGLYIAGWPQFVQYATETMSGGSFIFRGQAKSSWRLQPTLLRQSDETTTTQDILSVEAEAMREFRAQAHLHIGAEHLPQHSESDTELSWWALMQHHGAPTRLLDWTESPFVAAYFAVSEHPMKEGVVFVADAEALRGGLNSVWGEADPKRWHGALGSVGVGSALFVWRPEVRRSARLVAQQGLFSGSVRANGSHDALRDVCRKHQCCPRHLEPARRWLFKPEVKDEILRNLRATNIAAHSLFPGLDGLGRSIGEIARIGRSRVAKTISDQTIRSDDKRPGVAQMAADAQNRQAEGMFGKAETVDTRESQDS